MHSTNANCIPPPKLLKQRWFWHGQIILSKDVVILKTIGLFLGVNRILVMYVQKEIAIIHWYLLPLLIGLKEKLWTIHHSVQSLSFDKGWFYGEQFDYIHIHHNDFIFISVLVMGMKTQYICLRNLNLYAMIMNMIWIIVHVLMMFTRWFNWLFFNMFSYHLAGLQCYFIFLYV